MILAGLANILGISLFSKFFSNKNLANFDSIFDLRGNILIVLWGLTYIFTQNTYKNPVMIVFFIEKMVYVVNYFLALRNKLEEIKDFWKDDKLTCIFLSIYGIVDLVFGAIFLYLYFNN